MSEPVQVVAPERLPITQDEAREILKDPEDEEYWIRFAMTAATRHAEMVLNRSLITRTYDLYLDNFNFDSLVLPRPPAIAVESIKYDDKDNQEATVDSTVYQVDVVSDPGVIYRLSGKCWPVLVDCSIKQLNRVRVRYTAGYGDHLQSHPDMEMIRMGILHLVVHFFRERQIVSAADLGKVPLTGEDLLLPFRYWAP